ncbi:MAG: ABC transporter substrate-binding protein [Rhodomicrobium sp.]
MITRRSFLSCVASAAATLPTRAELLSRAIRKIGVLLSFASDDSEVQVRVRAFEDALESRGWRLSQDLKVEYRFAAGDPKRITSFARELIALKVEAIVTNAIQPVLVIRAQNRDIPIVLAMIPDPVESGFLRSLSHPDVNITGFASFDYTIVGKWLELLKAAVPAVVRIGLLFDPDAYDPTLASWSHYVTYFERYAPSFVIQHTTMPVRSFMEMQAFVGTFASPPPGGIIVTPDAFTVRYYREIAAVLLQHKVPACCPYNYFAAAGGLMSYGPNGRHIWTQCAFYVDRILQGAKATDLPIQRPTTLELVLNLKTAKALNLEFPMTLLARADEIIE